MVIERSNDLALQFGAGKNEVRVMCWCCMSKFKNSFE